MESVGNWVIESKLGSGSSSVVYACHNRFASSVRAAVKVLVDSVDPKAAAEEAQALAELEHANIVRVRDVGWLDEVPYLVMDLVEGPQLGPGHPLDVVLDTARALAHAHARGLQHGDVKAEHIRVVDGRGVLLDFGLSGPNRGGTPHYAPPEWFTGAPLDRSKQDVYALGVVLYDHLIGRDPTDADEALPRERSLDPGAGVAPALRGLVMRMTTLSAEARPTASEVVERLAAEVEPPPPSAAPEPVVAPPVPVSVSPPVSPPAPEPVSSWDVRPWVALAALGVVAVGWLGLRQLPDAASAPSEPVAPAVETPVQVETPAPTPPEAAPEPVSAPAEPVVAAAPRPEPTPMPERTAAPAPSPVGVSVSGDAQRVWLVQDGARFEPGQAPPGTYQVLALFSGVEPVAAGEVTVPEQGQVGLRCSSSLLVCQPVSP